MKTFKTTKGTQLPLLDLRGKDYLQVAHRLVWFREDHPDWGIETEIVSHDEKKSVVRASIKNAQGQIIAQSTKQEDAKGFTDHLEKAETGAVGRALALCGYGTQFAPDFEEGEDVVDSPVHRPRPTPVPATVGFSGDLDSYVIKTGKFSGKKLIDVGAAELRNYHDWCMRERKGNPEELKIFATYVASRTPAQKA